MDFFDAAKARHSYRGAYKDEPVPEEDLRRIVQAAIDAPSGCNFQTSEFVIVTDADLIARMGDLTGCEVIATAPAVIVVLCNTGPNRNGVRFWVEDCSAATENALLAVSALGYASCWIDGLLRREGRAEAIAEMLGVPDTHTVRILLPVGVAAEMGERPAKKPFEERAWMNRYGG